VQGIIASVDNLPRTFGIWVVQERKKERRRPWPIFFSFCLGRVKFIFFHELRGRRKIGELCDMPFFDHPQFLLHDGDFFFP
jgi:hypothetical protein